MAAQRVTAGKHQISHGPGRVRSCRSAARVVECELVRALHRPVSVEAL